MSNGNGRTFYVERFGRYTRKNVELSLRSEVLWTSLFLIYPRAQSISTLQYVLHPVSLIMSFWVALRRRPLFIGSFLLFMTVEWWRISKLNLVQREKKRMMNNTGIVKELHHLNKGQCDREIMEKGVKNKEGLRPWARKKGFFVCSSVIVSQRRSADFLPLSRCCLHSFVGGFPLKRTDSQKPRPFPPFHISNVLAGALVPAWFFLPTWKAPFLLSVTVNRECYESWECFLVYSGIHLFIYFFTVNKSDFCFFALLLVRKRDE